MTRGVPIDEARRLVLAATRPLPAEDVALEDALGRVLAEEVTSTVDVPPFDSSAMDGFAVPPGSAGRAGDRGESRAGRPVRGGSHPGRRDHASRPARWCRRAPRRWCRSSASRRRTAGHVPREPPAPTSAAPARTCARARPCCRRDASWGRRSWACWQRRARRPLAARAGRGVGRAGHRRRAGRAWRAARRRARSGARTHPRWPRRPRAPAASRGRGETVPDDPRRPLARRCARAVERSDVVCVSGGVSVGPHDHVKGALAGAGGRRALLGGARCAPGKPTWFGERPAGPVLAFGLPGQPGVGDGHLPAVRAPGACGRSRAPTRRPRADRGRSARRSSATRGATRRCAAAARRRRRLARDADGPQGSHVLTSMLGADALALVPPGEGALAAGERVEIELLDGPAGVSSAR